MIDKESIHTQVQAALEVLNKGGVILYPTDTVWGLGCDATNEQAVKKVFSIKKRADAKSLIALVCSDIQLQRTVREVPQLAWELIEYSQRPITIIYDQPVGIAPSAIAQDGSMGIRIVRDYFCEKLIERIRRPLISTSANISGKPSPSCFAQISPEIISAVDYVVDLRQDEKSASEPSTIIKLTNDNKITIIRK